MKTESVYTSVACNRSPACLDWGKNGFVIYGASCGICLLDLRFEKYPKIIRTFVKHKKTVNCVKWVRKIVHNETHFVSVANDCLVILWNISNSSQVILEGHTNSVHYADAIDDGKGVFLATASNSSIRMWFVINDKAKCFQVLNLQNRFCLSLAVAKLSKFDKFVLAEAEDDNVISLWLEVHMNEEKYFEKFHNLKGHEDWVRGLDFVETLSGDLLLSSSSQDAYIRLWRISPKVNNENSFNSLQVLESHEIRLEENLFSFAGKVNSEIISVCVESVLQGHEGWIYGVQWHKNSCGNIKLLSASIDKNLIIWEFNPDVGIWIEKYRLGDVGGGSLGFFGAKFSNNGKSVIGHSFHGGLHIWKQSENDDTIWESSITVSGHFDQVRDLCWEPNGEYIFSVSADQTTRIHAPFRQCNSDYNDSWHEIGRPQIHGYNMQSIAVINKYRFASAGEEKIIRIFQATADFIKNFHAICQITSDPEGDNILESIPKGATVPSLGLSNKAVYIYEEKTENQHVKDEYSENYYVSSSLTTPPPEQTLMQNTLWHETHKLYGHGFEIYSLVASPNCKWLASSCKASTADHADIFIWDSSNGKPIQKLVSHQLTVTQLKFSPNNEFLLSVSRDRNWSLFKNILEDSLNFVLEAKSDKTNGIHTRIIWSCDWTHDSNMFCTTSRDSKIVVWNKGKIEKENSLKKWEVLVCHEIHCQSVTAVCFAPIYFQHKINEYLMVTGLENGHINIFKLTTKLQHLYTITQEAAHHLPVKKLQFNPKGEKLFLASCGDDNFLRIFELKW